MSLVYSPPNKHISEFTDLDYLDLKRYMDTLEPYVSKIEFIYKITESVYPALYKVINGEKIYLDMKPSNKEENYQRWYFLIQTRAKAKCEEVLEAITPTLANQKNLEFTIQTHIDRHKKQLLLDTTMNKGYEHGKINDRLDPIWNSDFTADLSHVCSLYAAGLAVFYIEERLNEYLNERISEEFDGESPTGQLKPRAKMALLKEIGFIDFLLKEYNLYGRPTPIEELLIALFSKEFEGMKQDSVRGDIRHLISEHSKSPSNPKNRKIVNEFLSKIEMKR